MSGSTTRLRNFVLAVSQGFWLTSECTEVGTKRQKEVLVIGTKQGVVNDGGESPLAGPPHPTTGRVGVLEERWMQI